MCTVDADFEVEMRPGGETGAADVSDEIPEPHVLRSAPRSEDWWA